MDGAWHPSAALLELAELAIHGGLADLPDLPAADGVTLEDAEGTPVALLRGGEVLPLQPFTAPPLRRHRRSAAQVRQELDALGPGRPVLGVPVGPTLTDRQVAQVTDTAARLGAALLWLVLLGDRRPAELPPEAVLRATRQVAAGAGPGVVVPVAVPRLASQAADRELVAQVLAGYGATEIAELTESAPGQEHPAFAQERSRAHRPPDRRGLTVFFTGLSGSGKSTLAKQLQQRLAEDGRRTVSMLDGDEVRRLLSAGLGFSAADRDLNIRRIGFVAAEVSRHGGLAVCAPIAPFADVRAEVRGMVEAVGDFVLIYVSTPLAVCEARDRKGLYAKARRGEIAEFTGISSPYQPPGDADLVLDTSLLSVADAGDQVWKLLTGRGYLGRFDCP